MTGIVISLILVVVLIAYVYKLLNRVKVDKSFIKNALEKSYSEESFSTENISIKKIKGEVPEEEVEEMARYRIKAKSSSDKEYDLVAQVYNPEAEIENQEYEKIQKEARAEDKAADSAMSGDPIAANTATIESAQSMMQDQNKREAEERLIRSNILKYELGLKIANNLSNKSRLIPEIVQYDSKKLCAIYEYIGEKPFVDHFNSLDEEAQEALVIKIVSDLAKIHNNFEYVRALLPPRRDMEAEDFRQLLRLGLDKIYEARLISANQMQEILNEYFTVAIYLTDPYYPNIKVQSLSPYKMVVKEQEIFMVEFDKFDIAPHLTSLVEFLKDPLIYSGKEREKEAIAAYYSMHKTDWSFEEFTKMYHLTSCHLLTVQLFFMKLFIKKVEEKGKDLHSSPLVNWDKEHLELLFNDAKEYWSNYDESKFYIEKLEEIFLSV